MFKNKLTDAIVDNYRVNGFLFEEFKTLNDEIEIYYNNVNDPDFEHTDFEQSKKDLDEEDLLDLAEIIQIEFIEYYENESFLEDCEDELSEKQKNVMFEFIKNNIEFNFEKIIDYTNKLQLKEKLECRLEQKKENNKISKI
jgi:hypothetical protein